MGVGGIMGSLIERKKKLMMMQAQGLLPPGYRQVEWLGNPDGTAYLNFAVDFTLGQEAEFEIEAQCYENTDSNTFLCGWNSGFAVNMYITSSGKSWGNGASGYPNTDALTKTKIVLQIHNNKRTDYKFYVNDDLIAQASRSASSLVYLNNSYPLFCRMNTRSGSIVSGKEIGKFKIYNAKFTCNDVLQANLIPCIRVSDSEPGMYDIVAKTFYTNIGTGSFSIPQ